MNTNTKIKYILEMEADTKNVISAVDNIKNSLKNISLPQNLNKNFLNIFSNLETEVKNFLSLNGELSTFGDFTAAEKSGKRILELYRKLGVEAENLSDIDKAKLFHPETTAIINKISKAMKSFNNTVQDNRKSILDTKKEIAKYEASLISIKDAQDKVKQKTLVDPTQFSAAQKDVATYRNEVVAL
jgi:TP901 family phage tail tape measure protein